jgi:hypothetical protein
MEADLWWPAIFGDPNGRAAGLAQNANTAALLITVLASLFLPAEPKDRFNAFGIYAVLIAIAGVAFTQSKSGLLMAGILIAAFIWRSYKHRQEDFLGDHLSLCTLPALS